MRGHESYNQTASQSERVVENRYKRRNVEGQLCYVVNVLEDRKTFSEYSSTNQRTERGTALAAPSRLEDIFSSFLFSFGLYFLLLRALFTTRFDGIHDLEQVVVVLVVVIDPAARIIIIVVVVV